GRDGSPGRAEHLLGMLGLLRLPRHRGRGRQGGEGRAQPGEPGVPRRVLRERHPCPPGDDLPAGAPHPPVASRGRARLGAVGAGGLGRRPRRDGGEPGGGARPPRRPGPGRRGERRRLQPRAGDGAADALPRLAELDDQPGPLRRLPRGKRPDHRHRHHRRRRRGERRLPAARRPQSGGSGPAAMDGDEARQGAGLQGGRHRPVPHPGGRVGRSLVAAAARHRRRHRLGDDPPPGRRGRLGPRLRGPPLPRLRRVGGAGCALHPRNSRRHHRRARFRHRPRVGALRGGAVLLRFRPRHRRGQQRGADLPRLPRPGGDQRQPGPGGRQPARQAAAGLPHLDGPAARPALPPARGGGEAHHRRGPLPALGRPAGLADRLPQQLGAGSDADRRALPGAGAVRERREHRRHVPGHPAHARGAALARFPVRRRAHHDADRGGGRPRAAQDDGAGRGGGGADAQGAVRHLHRRCRAAAGRGPQRPRHRGGAAGPHARPRRRGGGAVAVAQPRGVQPLPHRRFGHLDGGAAAGRLRAVPLRAGRFREPGLRHAHGQGGTPLDAAREARARPLAGLRGAPGSAGRAECTGGLPAPAADRDPGEDVPPLPFPRAGLGSQGLAGPEGARPPRHRGGPRPARRRLGRGRSRRGERGRAAAGRRVGPDAARRADHRRRLVAARAARAGVRRPGRERQRGAVLHGADGPGHRLRGHGRDPVPRPARRRGAV
ncbi:MAG: Anaerobic dehydrogenases, typically selenocysteine-containing, partial [uncultured Acetobacteraceae bacterium]